MSFWETISKTSGDLTDYATPIFLLMILLESLVSSRRNLKNYQWKDSMASISMGLGSVVIDLLMKALAFSAFTYLHQWSIFELQYVWWVWVLAFFAEDLTFYWHHRLSHEIRLLWAAHVNHHSSQLLNLTTALRQSWGERFYKYIFWLWLPLVGFPPMMIMLLMSTNLIYQFFLHTQLVDKLGPIEWIFNTPSHHRVHHASNANYLDRNHAGTLIIWDRLFGTYVPESQTEKPVYGIVNNIHTYNPFVIASHEFISIWNDVRQAPSFGDKLKYIFYPPGWSHDGSKKTAKQLRNEYLNATKSKP
ncbi:MAG: sterol desaturase family protein [Cyclobacteriaceae bacterium]